MKIVCLSMTGLIMSNGVINTEIEVKIEMVRTVALAEGVELLLRVLRTPDPYAPCLSIHRAR